MTTNTNKTFHCPLCNSQLIRDRTVHACPNRHGALLQGRHIRDSHHTLATEKADSETVTNTDHPLTCPACAHSMEKVNFNNTGVIIDTCTNCPYRWLDDGELTKINTYKGTVDPAGMLTLHSVDTTLNTPRTALKEVDRIPGSWRTAARIYSGSGDSSTPIGIFGIYGIAKSLTHSNFTRILLLVIVILFVAMAAYMLS